MTLIRNQQPDFEVMKRNFSEGIEILKQGKIADFDVIEEHTFGRYNEHKRFYVELKYVHKADEIWFQLDLYKHANHPTWKLSILYFSDEPQASKFIPDLDIREVEQKIIQQLENHPKLRLFMLC